MGNGLDDVKSVSNVEKHIVVAPAALEAAKYLERTFGTPYEIAYPLVDELVYDMDYSGKKVLVVQQQVIGNAIREEILKKASDVQVTVASWFMMKSELRQDGDLHLRDEDDYMELVENGEFDVIYACLLYTSHNHKDEYPRFTLKGSGQLFAAGRILSGSF